MKLNEKDLERSRELMNKISEIDTMSKTLNEKAISILDGTKYSHIEIRLESDADLEEALSDDGADPFMALMMKMGKAKAKKCENMGIHLEDDELIEVLTMLINYKEKRRRDYALELLKLGIEI